MARTVSSNTGLIEQVVQLSRPANAIHPLLALFAGYLLVGGTITTRDWSLLIVAVCLVSIHAGITIQNDVADRDIDLRNNVTTPITHGYVRMQRIFAAIAWALLIAPLVVLVELNIILLPYAFALVALGVLYNYGLRLSRRPVSSLVALAISYGFLPVVIGAVMSGAGVDGTVIGFALAYMLIRSALSFLKDFKDIEGDKAGGKQTFLIRYGSHTTLMVSNILFVLGAVAVSVLLGMRVKEPLQWLPIVVLASVYVYIGVIRLRMIKAGLEAVILDFDRLVILQVLSDVGIVACLLLL